MSTHGRSHRLLLRLLAIFLGVGLLASGCSSDDGDDGSEGPEQPGNANVDEEGLEPQPGGEIVFGLEALTEGGWCLPEAQLAASGIQVAGALYDGLTRFNDQLEPVPYLAESFEPNETYDVWTVKLRPDIKFHNGEPLNAEAVAMNLNAFRGTETFDLLPTLFPFVLEDISDVSVVDDLTLTITTSRPWVALPSYFATGRFGISAPEQLQGDRGTCANTPIGTGPFKAVGTPWNLTGEVSVEKNDDYWRTDEAGNPLPYLDRITFRAQPDTTRRVENLTATSGGFDMTHTDSALDIEEMQALAEEGEIRLVVEDNDFAEVSYVMINSGPESDSPFADIRMRQAIAMAVDRSAVNDLINDGFNTITDSPFGPGVLGYVEDTGFPAYDPEAAQELIDEVVADNGGEPITIDMLHTPTPVTRDLAEEIITQLSAYEGIEINAGDPNQYEHLQSALINKALAGDFDLMLWRNHPGADPDTQYVWWHSTSPVNFGKITDEEVDRLLDEGRSAPPEERQQIYEDLNKRLGEQVYNIWSWYSVWTVGAKNRVHGLTTQTLPNGDAVLPVYVGVSPLWGIWVDDAE
ncbi:MAG: hypothetical protein JJLCMIEE_01336 [Acidimicrobiales bacterium]|nr:hypothetical protein [Acidimicrobiales bacterium]